LVKNVLNKNRLTQPNMVFQRIMKQFGKIKRIDSLLTYRYFPNILKTVIMLMPFNIGKKVKSQLISPLLRMQEAKKRYEKMAREIPPWVDKLVTPAPAKTADKPQITVTEATEWKNHARFLINEVSPSKRLKKSKQPPIENLVFEGGSFGTIAYGG